MMQHTTEREDAGERKWMCDYCTYLNWPSSTKCCMCRAPSTHTQGQDIYSLDRLERGAVSSCPPVPATSFGLADGPCHNNNNNMFNVDSSGGVDDSGEIGGGTDYYGGGLKAICPSSPASQYHQQFYSAATLKSTLQASFSETNSAEQHKKWSCSVCTYFNYARAVRCTQCLSARKKVSPSLSRNSPSSPRNGSPLPSSVGAITSAATVSNTATTAITLPPQPNNSSCSNSNNSSCSSISTANRANSIRSLTDQLHPLHISVASSTGNTPLAESSRTNSQPPSSSAKWNCPVCTYENWPRSPNCVLCGALPAKERTTAMPDHLQSFPTVRDSPSPEGASMPRRIDGAEAPRTQHQPPPPVSTSGPTDLQQRRSSPTIIGDSKEMATAVVEQRYQTNQHRPGGTGSGSGGTTDYRLSPAASTAATAAASDHMLTAGGSSVAGATGSNNIEYEKRLRQLRRRMRETDWAWVSACMGVVEGDACPVEAYLNSGGDPTRKLTHSEASALARPGVVFETGHTLVHLAIRFHREDLLATLLSQMEGLSHPCVKRVPSYVAPDLAAAIRRQLALSLRHRKGGFPCFYLSDSATYTLPPEIEDLPRNIQDQLYAELLDKDARTELESELCINWSDEITCVLGSRLYPLWNRSAGDCLLDAALQATWGVFDRDNMLRRALADSLTEAGHVFYPRWKEWETRQAQELSFSLADSQWDADWADLLSLAGQPGASLEQTHIFCLAHVLRRPIIVYGVKYVKSWRGENLGLAKFQGVYLPLLWESSFCYRSPIALGYTRGHFCALVPPEPDIGCGGAGGGAAPPTPQAKCAYLPLMTREREVLPLHFTSRNDIGREDSILRHWMDVGITESGIMVAEQGISRPPLLVAQMTEEWLNYYRKIAQSTSAPMTGRHPLSPRIELECSEDSTDDE